MDAAHEQRCLPMLILHVSLDAAPDQKLDNMLFI